MMQGLDYVMAQACQHGLRVVLTLTNYLTAYGGHADVGAVVRRQDGPGVLHQPHHV